MKNRPTQRAFWWYLNLGCHGSFLIGIALFSLWGNYLMVEYDWLKLVEWKSSGCESSVLLELFLHEKLDCSSASVFMWLFTRWFGIPALVFLLISNMGFVQPYWWLALWINRVNASGDRLEERLQSYWEVSIPESIALYFKALSLDVQSGMIRRVVKLVHRKYQIDPTDTSSPPP